MDILVRAKHSQPHGRHNKAPLYLASNRGQTDPPFKRWVNMTSRTPWQLPLPLPRPRPRPRLPGPRPRHAMAATTSTNTTTTTRTTTTTTTTCIATTTTHSAACEYAIHHDDYYDAQDYDHQRAQTADGQTTGLALQTSTSSNYIYYHTTDTFWDPPSKTTARDNTTFQCKTHGHHDHNLEHDP